MRMPNGAKKCQEMLFFDAMGLGSRWILQMLPMCQESIPEVFSKRPKKMPWKVF